MNQFVHDRKKQIKFKGISISSGRVAGGSAFTLQTPQSSTISTTNGVL